MNFRERLKNDQTVITAELFSVKGTDMSGIERKVTLLRDYIHAFNVTDNQRATMRVSSLGVCSYIKQRFGVETVFQLNCRDRNRLALQSDILAASVLGLKNVLVITGDHPSVGDHEYTKAVYDMDSVSLIQTIDQLKKGQDYAGNSLKGKIDMFIGGAVNPSARPLEPHLMKFEKKINSGAGFFQTQVVFDAEKYKEFYKKAREFGIPVIVGISLIKNVKFAEFINRSVPGLNIPDHIIERLRTSRDYKKERIDIACELIEELKGYCQGFHFMVFGLEKEIPVILKRTGLAGL